VAPGKRIDDLAYFKWTFLDLGISLDSDDNQIQSIRKLIDAYGSIRNEDLIPALLRQQHRIFEFRKLNALTGKDKATRKFSAHKITEINKCIDWVITNEQKIMSIKITN